MRNYIVNVNGTDYQIKVEEITTGAAPAAKAPVAKPVQASAPAPAAPVAPAAKPKATAGAGQSINSPMPGTILSINVREGQPVKSGDVLMILEAMKMENEIMAPKDGIVTSLNVSGGTSVETGSVLCVIS